MTEIELPVWVTRGPLMIRRDALDGDDPDHPYNYIWRTYGVNPRLYGIEPDMSATAAKFARALCEADGKEWTALDNTQEDVMRWFNYGKICAAVHLSLSD